MRPGNADGLGDCSPRPLTCVYPAGSDRADVLRLRALLALRGVELDALVLVEALVAGSGDGGVVDEHVLAAVIGSDEAEALLAVEPLHSALCHVVLSFGGAVLRTHTVCVAWFLR